MTEADTAAEGAEDENTNNFILYLKNKKPPVGGFLFGFILLLRSTPFQRREVDEFNTYPPRRKRHPSRGEFCIIFFFLL